MPTYKVHYFNARGLAEPIRMILSYANADWTDERIEMTGIPTPIPEEIKSKSTFGQVPILEFDGNFLAQSHTIYRYLARKFNLTGGDDLAAARCDEIADGIKDYAGQWTASFYEKDEAKKAELVETARKNSTEKFLKVFNAIVEKNGDFVVGKSLTFADILLAYFPDNLGKIYKLDLLADFPALKAHRDRIFSLAGIKEYLASRPVTPM